jgi:hydrogenase nickel incorporation protein HypA/HybF
MHELAVTEEILRVALEHAERAQATRITDINLVIGALSTIVDDSVQFYFDFLSPDTIAAGAELHFERIPARLRCRQCQNEFEPGERDYHCPQCNTLGGEVIAGREFYLDSMQVE